MKRTIGLVFACGFCVYGQFGELACTDDGLQLYFSSTLKLAGAPPDQGELRIYRVAEDGLRLFAERGALAVTNTFGSGDGARNPQVSGDGRTVGLTLQGICESPDGCNSNAGTRAELRGRNGGILGEGSLVLSRNGGWALLAAAARPMGPGDSPGATLINLESGRRSTIPAPPFGVTRPLASNGTVLVRRQSTPGGFEIGLWRQGWFTPLMIEGQSFAWGISDNARVLLYTSFSGGPDKPQTRLVARDLVTPRDTVIFAPSEPQQFVWPMGMSNDGQWVLYRVAKTSLEGPAFVANTITGQTSPLDLPQGELVTGGTIDGRGDAVFLVTTAGRIVKIDMAGGRAQDVVPPTPYVRNLGQFPPGSMVRLEGALPRSVESLSGRILLDDQPLPVLLANETEIRVQIPWEIKAPAKVTFRLELPGESPLRQTQLIFMSGMEPRFEPLGPGEATTLGFKAVRADFSGLLTTDPQPGEIFHVFMTGLGPVKGHVETGVPTPIGPLFPIEGQMRCRFFPYTADAETLFAGLAPGMTGIYQVTFRMPEGPNPGRITGGSCSFSGGSSGGSFGWGHALMGSMP